MRGYIAVGLVASFVIAFAIGYMMGFRDGRRSAKEVLNSLYGQFGQVGWLPCDDCSDINTCAKLGCIKHEH